MIKLGPDTCRRLDVALAREWLVTNGLGGYASSTVIGTPTRRYHGLLIAAKQPNDRRVLVSHVDEMLTYGGLPYQISTTEYQNDVLSPAGYIHVLEFRLDRGLPVTTFEIGDATLEKRVWMVHGQATTIVQYRWSDSAVGPAELVLRPLLSGRSFHALCIGNPEYRPKLDVLPDGFQVWPDANGPLVRVRVPGSRVDSASAWYWRILYRRERERGLDYLEDLFLPGTLAVTLAPGDSTRLVLSTTAENTSDADRSASWQVEWQRRGDIGARGSVGPDDDFGSTLAIAADSFLVAAPMPTDKVRTESTLHDSAMAVPDSAIVGGYHWFSQSGRDALIGLPGLLIGCDRLAEARSVLQRLIGDRQDGLVPVRYAETDGQPDIASVDTSLWLFVALRAYLDRSGDDAFLADIWSALVDIIAAHVTGTRFGIQVDPNDGLLRAGETGRQLTWMDAKAGDWVVTPRRGKPVEVNALWYNAVRQMEEWAHSLDPEHVADFRRLAQQAEGSFTQKYWNFAGGFLYDVIDTEMGRDASCRPNQLLAISLPFPVLDSSRWRSVLDAVRDHLLTPYGIRTLSPADPHYVGWYAGDPVHRDGAYHQGAVRTWLLGPYFDASQRVYPGARHLSDQMQALAKHLEMAGLGTVGELFDGARPHSPQGSIADAAGVGEVLRVWRALHAHDVAATTGQWEYGSDLDR